MRNVLWIATVVVSSVVLTGCVTGRRTIPLDVPSSSAVPAVKDDIDIRSVVDNRHFENKPPSPSTPSINGDVNKMDKDTLKTMIGRQRNGYGKAMGDIQLAPGETVETRTRSLISEEMKRRGYATVPGSVNSMDVSINKFWAWFTPGFMTVTFESQLSCDIELVLKGKREKFTVEGYGKNPGQVASDANWKLAYSRAFDDFLKNLDSALISRGL